MKTPFLDHIFEDHRRIDTISLLEKMDRKVHFPPPPFLPCQKELLGSERNLFLFAIQTFASQEGCQDVTAVQRIFLGRQSLP